MLPLHVVTSYDPDMQFSISALSRLEGIGIPVMTSLEINTPLLQHFLSTFVPDAYTYIHLESLLNAWLSSGVFSSLRPTWRNLLLIIRLLNQDDLAQRMESYLSGTAEEQHSKMGTDESKSKLHYLSVYT